ncbi:MULTISPECIES: hypothetical protein [Sphingomonas]|nr:hypothetical protein [Sphingomonas bisphenolicum]
MTRWARICSVSVIAISCPSCSYVAKDLRSTGGVVGSVLDQRMFDARQSKQLVVLRGAILVAMVARAGTVYARDQRDADAYVNYMTAAADEINILMGQIQGDHSGLACDVRDSGASQEIALVRSSRLTSNQVATQRAETTDEKDIPSDRPNGDGCYTYSVNFESDLPMLERRLFRLAMAALPQEQAKKFLDQVTTGNAFGAAMAALNFSAKALDGLHSGAAVHRTGVELIFNQRTAKSRNDTCQTYATVYYAAACMGLDPDSLFVGKQDKPEDYKPVVDGRSFYAIMRNIRDSCRMIPMGIGEELGAREVDLNALRQKRIDQCDSIDYSPRSRWEPSRTQVMPAPVQKPAN